MALHRRRLVMVLNAAGVREEVYSTGRVLSAPLASVDENRHFFDERMVRLHTVLTRVGYELG